MVTYLRFRLQRVLRRYRREVANGLSGWRQYWRQNIRGKSRQLFMIRQFTLVWWSLIIISGLGLLWQVRAIGARSAVLQPRAGGIYTEAVVGKITTVNPILPDNGASADAVKLVYNGLTKFDTNGVLQADLATGWTISPDGKTYTFKLRSGVTWHDGVPFTAQDVVFTLAAIQNPDTRSPLAPSWQGVKVAAPDNQTVVFSLPKPYAPFINATTTGILPSHLLGSTEASAMRVTEFNQNPVGTGPFKLQRFQADDGQLDFQANDAYYGGRPLIRELQLKTFNTMNEAYTAFIRRQVMAVGGIEPKQVQSARQTGAIKLHEAAIPDEVAVFLRTSSGVTADKQVRAALALATNRDPIISEQLKGQANPLADPLVGTSLNLTGAPRQARFDVNKANATLEAAGWKKGSDGYRSKGKDKLRISMVTQAGSVYGPVARELQQQWKKAGVEVELRELDAENLQQSHIRPRRYDALLYGINTGGDPDVYAYWHSSQGKDPGLNLSVYKSTAVDQSLEAGRTVLDAQTRSAKYRSFVQAWVADNPAIMLYSPVYTYGVDRSVYGIKLRKLVTPADRFDGVEKWSVRVRALPGG